MKVFLRNLSMLALVIAAGCIASCKKGQDLDSTTSKMPANFASLPDTTKVRHLIDKQVPLDSIAVYLCDAAIGRIKNVHVDNFTDIDTYIYTHCGDKDFEVYALALDEYKKSLPLVDKLTLYKKTSLDDPDKIGYKLGLEYVNSVMEKKLAIGKVDREIADFRRACGNDDDTYNRFLIGFSTGIRSRTAGEISPDIVERYGSASPTLLRKRNSE